MYCSIFPPNFSIICPGKRLRSECPRSSLGIITATKSPILNSLVFFIPFIIMLSRHFFSTLCYFFTNFFEISRIINGFITTRISNNIMLFIVSQYFNCYTCYIILYFFNVIIHYLLNYYYYSLKFFTILS